MAPLGVTIARILLDKPESRRDPALRKYYDAGGRPLPPSFFYRDFFVDGAPAFVPKRHIPLLEVLDEAPPRSGRRPSCPTRERIFRRRRMRTWPGLKDRGLAGLEVFTSYHDDEQTRFYPEEAQDVRPGSDRGFGFSRPGETARRLRLHQGRRLRNGRSAPGKEAVVMIGWLDIVLAVIIVVTVIIGLIKGLIRELIGIAAAVGGFVLAAYHYQKAADLARRTHPQ